MFIVFIVVCIRGVSITEKLYFLLKKLLFGYLYLCLATEVSKYPKTFLSETFSHLIVLRYQNVTIFLSFRNRHSFTNYLANLSSQTYIQPFKSDIEVL